tara:strand:+ start:516 stop:797 length:282 start_codon:yes stop_codon:yes gene_type:complete
MITKIQNTKDLAYYNNAILLSELINKEVADSDNENLVTMQECIIDILFYTNNLQTHIANCKLANSKYREQRNQALLTADELRDEIEWNENNVI